MIVVTKDDLDIFKPSEQAIVLDGRPFGMVRNPEPDKFVLYRVVLNDLMEIATFPTLESLQRSLSNIEGIEYVRKS